MGDTQGNSIQGNGTQPNRQNATGLHAKISPTRQESTMSNASPTLSVTIKIDGKPPESEAARRELQNAISGLLNGHRHNRDDATLTITALEAMARSGTRMNSVRASLGGAETEMPLLAWICGHPIPQARIQPAIITKIAATVLDMKTTAGDMEEWATVPNFTQTGNQTGTVRQFLAAWQTTSQMEHYATGEHAQKIRDAASSGPTGRDVGSGGENTALFILRHILSLIRSGVTGLEISEELGRLINPEDLLVPDSSGTNGLTTIRDIINEWRFTDHRIIPLSQQQDEVAAIEHIETQGRAILMRRAVDSIQATTKNHETIPNMNGRQPRNAKNRQTDG